MNTYEAYVRVNYNDLVIKTVVIAENSQDAYFLLQSQYGKDNVIYLPLEIG